MDSQRDPASSAYDPSAHRRSSRDRPYDPNSYKPRQSYKPNRQSQQSDGPSLSTMSPYASPLSPEFPPNAGLAPRPPSLAYGAQESVNGVARSQSNRRRDTRDPRNQGSRIIDKPLPPTPPEVPEAPEAPRAPPPTSYREPSGGARQPVPQQGPGSGYTNPARARALEQYRRARGQVDPDSYNSAPRSEQQPSSRHHAASTQKYRSDDPIDNVRPEDYSSRRSRSGRTAARGYNPEAGVDPGSPGRRDSASDPSAQQRREWAPDRSPLQKLELTLQDISKEEKRAQVEEAELLAREARAGRGSQSRRTGRRTSAAPAPVAPIPPQAAGGDHLAEAGLVRSLSNKQKDRLQRSATIESKRPSDPDQLVNRNTGGFEYQEQEYQQGPPQGSQNPSSGSRRRTSLNHAAEIGAAAAVATGGSAIMADSRRRNHETSSSQPTGNGYDSRGLLRDENKAAGGAAIGETYAGYPARKPNARDHQDQAEFGSDGAPIHRNRRVTELLHLHRRDPAYPLKQPRLVPTNIEDWRGAKVARLISDDFALGATATAEDKAWWEKGGSSKRRSANTSIAYKDGDIDNLDGIVQSYYSDDKDSVSTGSPETRPSMDSVVLRGRQYIGYEGTSKDLNRVDRRNKILLRNLPTAGAYWDSTRSKRPTSPEFYSYSCPKISEHDVFHPNHICPGIVDKKLTMAMRSIRVRKAAAPTSFKPPLFLKCGPLLRYTGIRRDRPPATSSNRNGALMTDREIWRGTILIVTTDSDSSYEQPPTLRLFSQPMDLHPPPPAQVDGEHGELAPEYVDPIAGLPVVSRTGQTLYVKPVDHLPEGKDLSRVETSDGLFEEVPAPPDTHGYPAADGPNDNPVASNNRRQPGRDGEKLGKFKEVEGARLHAERGVTFWRFKIEVELGPRQAHIAYRINRGPAIGFWVPARGETMNIMFHSCNGFSLSVNPDHFSGPDPLWRDVLNSHQTRPFHVMLGGGDQIYNDAVMKQTTIFHDWLNIKNPLNKYNAEFTPEMQEELETFYLERYSMWFSQGLFGMANSQIPMINMWDDHDIIDGYGSYPHHLMSSPVFSGLGAVAYKYYMLFQHHSVSGETEAEEPSWLLGAAPGPYIHERSRSVFMSLGKKVAFLGLDNRTERMRDEVMTEESYHLVFDRLNKEIIRGETKHLIVLLGIPIAYPRLVWLENILTSRAMDPIKAFGRATGALGGLLNQFDGGVEVLDDLDDHWTAKNHKSERSWFIQELQELASGKSIRITILSGDVHLAAIGRFYSNPKLGIPKDYDHRYIYNIVSSAIVNTPPPPLMGDILNKRNKTHHLDQETEEDMIPIFTHDVDNTPRNNKRLLPRRNWCSLREYYPGSTPPQSPSTPKSEMPQSPQTRPGAFRRTLSLSRGDMMPGALVRRLSRQGRPASYLDAAARPRSEERVVPPGASAEGYFPPPPGQSNATQSLAPGRTPFHRQPTDLGNSRRGRTLKRGGQGHVNFEDGLEVVLNVEISQTDPSGSTIPYRLLVPALWYRGREDKNPLMLRRGSLWNRIRERRRRGDVSGSEDEYDTTDEGGPTANDERNGSRDPRPMLEGRRPSLWNRMKERGTRGYTYESDPEDGYNEVEEGRSAERNRRDESREPRTVTGAYVRRPSLMGRIARRIRPQDEDYEAHDGAQDPRIRDTAPYNGSRDDNMGPRSTGPVRSPSLMGRLARKLRPQDDAYGDAGRGSDPRIEGRENGHRIGGGDPVDTRPYNGPRDYNDARSSNLPIDQRRPSRRDRNMDIADAGRRDTRAAQRRQDDKPFNDVPADDMGLDPDHLSNDDHDDPSPEPRTNGRRTVPRRRRDPRGDGYL